MILGARTGAWGGKALPYDAEVEWFTHNYFGFYAGYTNANSFDLGFVYDNDTGFEFEATRLVDNTADQVAFGSRDKSGGDNRYFIGGTVNRLWYFGYGTRKDFGNCVIGEKVVLSLNMFNTKEIKLNGVSGGFFSSTFIGNNAEVCYPGYFAASVFNYFRISGVSGAYYRNGNTYNPYYRYGYLKLTKGDSLVRDIIPVRVGEKLRLFDKVSNSLIDPLINDSIATFTLGPDKTT